MGVVRVALSAEISLIAASLMGGGCLGIVVLVTCFSSCFFHVMSMLH